MKSIFNFRFTLLMFFCLTMAMAKDARVSTRKLKEPKNTKAPKKTKEPKNTKAPKKTKEPKNTKAPKKTKEPKKTKAPKKTKEPKNTKAPGSIQPLSKAEVAPEEVGWGVGALGFGLLGLAYLTLRRKKTRRQESLESLEEHQDANLDDLQESNQPDDASLGHEVSPGQLQLEDPDSTKLTPSWWC